MTGIGLTTGPFDVAAFGEITLPFSREEYLGRIAKLRAVMLDEGIDLLWVTTPGVMCWLHGFTSSWYKGNAPTRYPQCYGTAIWAHDERFTYFDNPPATSVERYKLAAGVFDVIAREVKAGMTVREVNTLLQRYYDNVGLWTEDEGWALGYELGLSFPPDWVGDFYLHLGDDKYVDRVYEENMVTNFESSFNTAMIDTLIYGKGGTRLLSKTPLELRVIG